MMYNQEGSWFQRNGELRRRKEACTNSRIELLTRTNKSAGTNSNGLVQQLRDLARIQRRRNLEFMWIVVSIATTGNFETGKLEFFQSNFGTTVITDTRLLDALMRTYALRRRSIQRD